MKLPQYRLLKISSSRKGTSIVAEWVDVVTCGECKYWLDGSGLCKHWSKLYGSVLTKADDFCSYGERRES